MIVGIAMDSKGKPLCCEMWPGNTAVRAAIPPTLRELPIPENVVPTP